MVGLGETTEEVKQVMRDQRAWGVDILTLGQYLQPSKKHLPIDRYYTLEEFAELKELRAFDRFQMGGKWSTGAIIVSCRGSSTRIEPRSPPALRRNQA